MSNFIFVNSQLVNPSDCLISIDQRGFLYGDGVFETCKIHAKKIINFDAHLDRLSHALSHLKLSSDLKIIENNSQILIHKNQFDEGILRISISRGIGSRGYLPTNGSQELSIIETKNTFALPAEIKLGISYRNTPGFFFKSHSALSYVLTKIDANENGYFDNIMIDQMGNICETSCANIFWIKNDQIFTAHENTGIVQGCVRKKILAQNQLNIIKTYGSLTDIINSDEVFLTNSNSLLICVDKLYFQEKGQVIEKIFCKKIGPIIKQDIQSQLYNFL